MKTDLEAAITKLVAYCRASEWAGYDPYDALNSRLFRILPILNHRLPRVVFTQALKRSPINFRRLLRIPKTQNPKAIALFLSAFVTLKGTRICRERDIEFMIDRLRLLRSPATDYWAWGYSFPWQTRTVVVASGVPNLVCTSFVANALLDVAEQRGDSKCLDMALSAAQYIVEKLYWTDAGAAGFSYPLPSVRTNIHNANFLAAALLSRVYSHTHDENFLVPALRASRHSAKHQRPDGSWYYGEAPSQRWIDNFHTGYNLCALETISRYTLTPEFDAIVRRGFDFYRSHFFLANGAVRYFHNRNYPIDTHCIAQSILTLLMLRHLDSGNLSLAQSVLRWALTHMWDDRGFFYYRVLRTSTDRTSYMRWSQAWMLLAMVTLWNVSGSDGIN
jgi:hypothetical protein